MTQLGCLVLLSFGLSAVACRSGGSSFNGASSNGGAPATGNSKARGGVATKRGTVSTSAVVKQPVSGKTAAIMPRVGVGSPSYASTGTAALINDGKYKVPYAWTISGCSASSPCWAAIKLGAGPSQLLAQLSYEGDLGLFSSTKSVNDYAILVSKDSTNGADGTWVTATDVFTEQPVAISANAYSFRAHKIQFGGYSWVKLRVSASGVPNVDELDLWDASASTDSTFFFQGDSITCRCGTRGTSPGWEEQPSFQSLFSEQFPMITNGGTVGVGSVFAETNVAAYLAAFPMTKYWFYILGTNDLCYRTPAQFSATVQSWVTKVKAAGKTPILAHPIWANDVTTYCFENGPAFNVVIDTLVQRNGLLPAVPLYEGTVGHSEYFQTGDVHPNHDGCRAWNRIFATYVSTNLAHN